MMPAAGFERRHVRVANSFCLMVEERQSSDKMPMKRTVSTILWTIASQVVGLVIFFIYIMAIDPSRTHAGVIARLFVIGLPVLVLLFGFCGVLPGTRRSGEAART